MFNFFSRKSVSLSKVVSQLVDQLYQAQRDRLTHTAAAERCSHMGKMCLVRKERLEKELVELAGQPAEKTGLFRRESIDSIVRSQLASTQVEYLDHMSQAEHHDALAKMYAIRVTRLRATTAEMAAVATLPNLAVTATRQDSKRADAAVSEPVWNRGELPAA